MSTRGSSGGHGRNTIISPRWGRLAATCAASCLVGLGVLKVIGLPWSAVAGCALVLAVGMPLYMWRWKKGLDEWAAEDRDAEAGID